MTYTSSLNSVALILGPVIATYFAFEINRREEGQSTAFMALLLNFIAQSVKLTCLAMIALMLGMNSDTNDSDKSLAFYWGQITLNALLAVALETGALYYCFMQRKLMQFESRKMPKIVAISCGWAIGHLMSSQVLRAVSSQLYEETVRYDLLLSNFSAVLDFVRIIGMALLVEKMSRKGASQEAKTFIVCILVALAFLTEVFTSRVESVETQLN